MPIYRMTKDERNKRETMVKEDTISSKEYKSIIKSKKKIQDKLIQELTEVKTMLSRSL